MRTKLIITSMLAATITLTPMLPALAAHAATNPLQTFEQAGKKALTNAEKQAKGLLSSMATAGDPTAAQVTQGLLNFYSTQKVWPYHLLGISNTNQSDATFLGNPPAGTQWDTNFNDWVGLKTVFPGQLATSWAKDLGMTNAPANKPITAGTLAQWILNWEQDARAVKLVLNGKHMYPTTSAFGLLQLYSVFYGTNITSPKTMINQHDLQQVIKNLTDVGNGYRLLAPNKMELLLPLWGVAGGVGNFAKPYPQWWADGVQEADSVTFTFNPNGSVTYDRAHYAGMVMLHSFNFISSDRNVYYNAQNTIGFPQQQVSGKVPLTVTPYPLKNFGKWTDGPNSLNTNWEPFGGTYFYTSFTGPSNETTIANDNKVANEAVTGLPRDYFIQVTNGRIENVLFANEMNSYPLQLYTNH